jgi:hypothetical protein
MRGKQPSASVGSLQVRILTILGGCVVLALALYFGAFAPLLRRVKHGKDSHGHGHGRGHGHDEGAGSAAAAAAAAAHDHASSPRLAAAAPAAAPASTMDRDLLVAVLTAMVPKEGLDLSNVERALDILTLSGRLPSKALGAVPHAPSAAMLARPVRIVQIGANDGGNANDPLSGRLNATEGRMEVAMVEPVPHLFAKLAQRARSTPGWGGVTPLWGASCPLTAGAGASAPFYSFAPNATDVEYFHTRSMQRQRYDESVFQIGSFNKRHLMHNSGSSEEDLDRVLQVHHVPCLSLAGIMCRMGWQEVDFFAVDAEGVDDQVIFGAQLEATRPFMVRLEAQHIEGSIVIKFLEDLGYLTLKIKAHGVAEILAIWGNLKNRPPPQPLDCKGAAAAAAEPALAKP